MLTLLQAICPSAVRTNLLSEQAWQQFPQDYFVPLSKIVEVVLLLLDGDGKKDGKPLAGQTVELSGEKHYFRDQIEYCDEPMAKMMGSKGVLG
jgi:hypothetical protein